MALRSHTLARESSAYVLSVLKELILSIASKFLLSFAVLVSRRGTTTFEASFSSSCSGFMGF